MKNDWFNVLNDFINIPFDENLAYEFEIFFKDFIFLKKENKNIILRRINNNKKLSRVKRGITFLNFLPLWWIIFIDINILIEPPIKASVNSIFSEILNSFLIAFLLSMYIRQKRAMFINIK